MCEHYLDPAEHAGIEDVHAGVDLVGDEDLRFLHEALNRPAVRLVNHHAVLGGLLHTRHLHTNTFISFSFLFVSVFNRTRLLPVCWNPHFIYFLIFLLVLFHQHDEETNIPQ